MTKQELIDKCWQALGEEPTKLPVSLKYIALSASNLGGEVPIDVVLLMAQYIDQEEG
jgi:hypothetical protein